MTVAGLLLAAGAGRRMGRPKALVELDGQPLVLRALAAMAGAGLAPRVVVLGAGADAVAPLLPPDTLTVVAPGWETGMGASLRAGLGALGGRGDTGPGITAALVHLVDLPGIGAAALARVAARASSDPGSPAATPGAGVEVLARGAYRGRPGHPVLLGAAHWPAVAAGAEGDAGARGYLADHPGVELVEVGDVADPADVDTPEDLARAQEQRRRQG